MRLEADGKLAIITLIQKRRSVNHSVFRVPASSVSIRKITITRRRKIEAVMLATVIANTNKTFSFKFKVL
jgi:hypothetical protein